ncbi:MAG: bicA [Phycisphaerales bacterium]|nr:bicA [Phycisphaerales bacterium]
MLDFFHRHTRNAKDDILAGLTTSLAMVPEAVAFGFVAGVSPVVALYSTFFVGLITAMFGGRPAMISGAAGSMAVVSVGLISLHGLNYLFPTIILCGLIQAAVGLFRLGKFIRMVPHSVMLGFVNGLAIIICLAQFGSFKTVNSIGQLTFLRGPSLFIMIGLVGLTMAVIWLLPKFTRAVPAGLVAIVLATALSLSINRLAPHSWAGENQPHAVMTIGDMLRTNTIAKAMHEQSPNPFSNFNIIHQEVGHREEVQTRQPTREELTNQVIDDVDAHYTGLAAGLPKLFFTEHALPPISFATLWIILPFAATLAGVGLVESLMTMTLVDEITATRGGGNRESLGQGMANIVCGLFGGMGGCAMIGQTLINVNSGGRGRLSGVTTATAILLFVLVFSRFIEQVPMAALVGVMFMVVIGTFEWASVYLWRRVPAADTLVMLIVTAYTVYHSDLAGAVFWGVIVSALVFAWQHATHIGAEIKVETNGTKRYQLHGPLFFASASSFKELFDPKADPDDVVIDFYFTRVYDQSGLEAINWLADKYRGAGKRLHLTHLSPECRDLLDRAGDVVEVNVLEDPQYHVATDRLG